MLRIRLSPEQRTEVQALRRDRSLKPVERDRVEMILLSDAGRTVPEIAQYLGCHPQTVRRLFARWRESGSVAIRQRAPGPAPDRARREHIESALRSELAQLRTWGSRDLAIALRGHGIELSARQLRKYLHRTVPGIAGRRGPWLISRTPRVWRPRQPNWRDEKTR